MNELYYLKKFEDIKELKDDEKEHMAADKLLCDALCELGYINIVEAYEKITKYYS